MRQVPSLSYGASPATCDRTVLPATRHKWTHPTLTPTHRRVLNLPIPEGWKAGLGYMAMQRQESNSWPVDRKCNALTSNHCTTEPCYLLTYMSLAVLGWSWCVHTVHQSWTDSVTSNHCTTEPCYLLTYMSLAVLGWSWCVHTVHQSWTDSYFLAI